MIAIAQCAEVRTTFGNAGSDFGVDGKQNCCFDVPAALFERRSTGFEMISDSAENLFKRDTIPE
ncbi:hypothetical protein [Pseudaminobacter salicylatoxidans]|uniref:hypothetical protein n=1 Tax=Pseudaminobacter salicylatoxidans TaxID=93369 RepID=UPI001FCAD643|nr:hypothetical protein [Pseudaminobacter salicylatoxidans]